MFTMGTLEIVLCVLAGHFLAGRSAVNGQDAAFPRGFPGLFDSIAPFPFKTRSGFTPYDTIFSSWRTGIPDFHVLAESPPAADVPPVEVSCDESTLTLLVEKRSSGAAQTQLGDGCRSNGELPDQWVFTYGLDECGTTRVMQNGLEVFTNSLLLNLKNPPLTWWQTPSLVHISCIPNRSYNKPNFYVSAALPENDKSFHIKALNPSWTGTAESNIYKRGELVNLQVSAKTRPEQQLYVQSCFVSASPEPQTRPKHTIIMNKGCTAPLGSPNAVIQFVASYRPDEVNFVLNTSYLISELYIHCSALISDQGVTSGSKSCNYNVIQSRWEDLSGSAKVCECCSSKCKGLSVKHLSEDSKAVVSTGPFFIVDKHVERSPEPPVSEPHVTDSMQSDGAAADDAIVSGTSVSRSQFSPLEGVVVMSQDPVVRLTLWLPGQVQDTEHVREIGSEYEDGLKVQFQGSDAVSMQPSAMDQEALLNTPTSKIGDKSADELGSDAHLWDLNLLTLVDGWVLPRQLEKAAIADESQRKMQFNKVGYELAQRQADSAVAPQEETNDARPIIRSKLQFSEGTDGLQTLSYEEEVVKQQEGDGVLKSKREPRQRLFSMFLDFLRRMDKAE